MRSTRWTRAAVAAAALVAAVVLPGSRPAYGDNPWGADYFPNVSLTTQDGVTVRFYDDLLKGKSVAINLIYTSCTDECPLETARLVQVQRLLGDRIGKDLFLYSISIDPKRDTPEVLKAYAAKFGVGPGWLFLTGKEGDVKLVAKKLGLSRSNDAASRDGHKAILMIGNEPTGQWMRNSAVDNPRFLATTISNFMGWKNSQPVRSYTEATKPSRSDAGAYVFQSRCGACHTVGKGDTVGPDLAAVTTRRERDWLVRYLKHPDQMLADKDPIAVALFEKYQNVPMPNLRLTEGEIAAVLSFLETASR
jgi:protein SCO1